MCLGGFAVPESTPRLLVETSEVFLRGHMAITLRSGDITLRSSFRGGLGVQARLTQPLASLGYSGGQGGRCDSRCSRDSQTEASAPISDSEVCLSISLFPGLAKLVACKPSDDKVRLLNLSLRLNAALSL